MPSTVAILTPVLHHKFQAHSQVTVNSPPEHENEWFVWFVNAFQYLMFIGPCIIVIAEG